MADFKLVLGTKDGKCFQKEVKDAEASYFMGKKVGDKVKGEEFGMPGFECEITGGSDSSGFPMRKDVSGVMKKKILATKGIGLKEKRHGQRQRKTVAGNEVYDGTVQINLKVLKGELPKEAPAEEAKEAPAEEKKE